MIQYDPIDDDDRLSPIFTRNFSFCDKKTSQSPMGNQRLMGYCCSGGTVDDCDVVMYGKKDRLKNVAMRCRCVYIYHYHCMCSGVS